MLTAILVAAIGLPSATIYFETTGPVVDVYMDWTGVQGEDVIDAYQVVIANQAAVDAFLGGTYENVVFTMHASGTTPTVIDMNGCDVDQIIVMDGYCSLGEPGCAGDSGNAYLGRIELGVYVGEVTGTCVGCFGQDCTFRTVGAVNGLWIDTFIVSGNTADYDGDGWVGIGDFLTVLGEWDGLGIEALLAVLSEWGWTSSITENMQFDGNKGGGDPWKYTTEEYNDETFGDGPAYGGPAGGQYVDH